MAYLAPSLAGLRAEVKRRWPNATVYWINDHPWVIHQNDHAPDPKGMVHAIDVMVTGTDPIIVRDVARRHPGVTRYVIYNRHIYHVRNNMQPEPYTGSNPHTDHVHISIEYTQAAEDWSGLWGVVSSIGGIGTAPPEAGVGAVTSGPWDFSPAVFTLARHLRGMADNLNAVTDALYARIR